MSFSSEVKEELADHMPGARHCQIAEIAALVQFGCVLGGTLKQPQLELKTESEAAVRKYFTLLKKTFIIDTNIEKVLETLKLFENGRQIRTLDEEINPVLLRSTCCKRSFLRGAFLCIGSMSDPHKGYHLEYVCEQENQALQLQTLLQSFELDAKIVMRKRYHVVYLKEGACIVDLLNIMGAHLSLMNLENLRIEKEMRNSINRKVNCEAANITKTVNAASKQIEDILLIQKNRGFSELPDNLREMAEIRLSYPDASLKELGEYLSPAVGKSGVNHRLRKLSEYAQEFK